MAKSVEEARREHAEAQAKAAREKELARRAAIKKGQQAASANVHRPLVTPG